MIDPEQFISKYSWLSSKMTYGIELGSEQSYNNKSGTPFVPATILSTLNRFKPWVRFTNHIGPSFSLHYLTIFMSILGTF